MTVVGASSFWTKAGVLVEAKRLLILLVYDGDQPGMPRLGKIDQRPPNARSAMLGRNEQRVDRIGRQAEET